MSTIVLLDTGPLVASLYKRDQHHLWAKRTLATLPSLFLTCEAVLTEACFLTYKLLGHSDPLIEMVENDLLRLDFDLKREISAVHSLMKRYADVPMSLADACLVRMSELYSDSVVLTTDSDFSIYRKHKRQAIPTIMPPSDR